jgi:hypothetical protein
VFTATVIGASPETGSRAARNARVRRSVAQVSTTTIPASVTRAPALFTHQEPPGWIQA